MATTFNEGDRVRITRGKYAGTVGTWKNGGVVNHYGYTGACRPGSNTKRVPNDTPMCEIQDGKVLWTEGTTGK